MSAALAVFQGDRSVDLTDTDGYSATLGATELKAKTGTVEKRSAASLVLSGKDQKVIWSAR